LLRTGAPRWGAPTLPQALLTSVVQCQGRRTKGLNVGCSAKLHRFAPGSITTKVSQLPMINETLTYHEISMLDVISRVKPYAVSHQFSTKICSDPAK
jgi:hypothetical protein